MARGFYPGQRGHKGDRENARALRRQEKADRLAQRRVEKKLLQGVEIEQLPEACRGIAKFLANGGENSGT